MGGRGHRWDGRTRVVRKAKKTASDRQRVRGRTDLWIQGIDGQRARKPHGDGKAVFGGAGATVFETGRIRRQEVSHRPLDP